MEIRVGVWASIGLESPIVLFMADIADSVSRNFRLRKRLEVGSTAILKWRSDVRYVRRCFPDGAHQLTDSL